MKNRPQKLLIIGPDPFIPQTSPGHRPQPKIDFPYHEISGPHICSLICAKQHCQLSPFYPILIVGKKEAFVVFLASINLLCEPLLLFGELILSLFSSSLFFCWMALISLANVSNKKCQFLRLWWIWNNSSRVKLVPIKDRKYHEIHTL